MTGPRVGLIAVTLGWLLGACTDHPPPNLTLIPPDGGAAADGTADSTRATDGPVDPADVETMRSDGAPTEADTGAADAAPTADLSPADRGAVTDVSPPDAGPLDSTTPDAAAVDGSPPDAAPLDPSTGCRRGDRAACRQACADGDLLACRISCAEGVVPDCRLPCVAGDMAACEAVCDGGEAGADEACAAACRADPGADRRCAAACLAGDGQACRAVCRADPADVEACASACLNAADGFACGQFVERGCWLTLGWADLSPIPNLDEDNACQRLRDQGADPDLCERDEARIGDLSHVPSDQYFVHRYVFNDFRTTVWPVEVTLTTRGGHEEDADVVAGCPGDGAVPFPGPVVEGLARRDYPRWRNDPLAPGWGFAMCDATRRNGAFRYVRLRGGFDNSDVFGLAFACTPYVDGARAQLARLVETGCSAELTRADNFCGAALEGHHQWYTRPHNGREATCVQPDPTCEGDCRIPNRCEDTGNYMAASTDGQRGAFALLPTPMFRAPDGGAATALRQPPGDTDRTYSQWSRDDSVGVRWTCDGSPLGRRLESSVSVAVAWVIGSGPGDALGADGPSAAECQAGVRDGDATWRCASSSYDGLYHRFTLPFDELAPPGRDCANEFPGCGYEADECRRGSFTPVPADDGGVECGRRPHDVGVALRGRPLFP